MKKKKPLSPQMEKLKAERRAPKKKKRMAAKSATPAAKKKKAVSKKKADKGPVVFPRVLEVKEKNKDHFTPIRHEAIRWSFSKSGDLFATYQLLLSHTSRSRKGEPEKYVVWRGMDGLAILRGIARRTFEKHICDLIALDLIARTKRKEYDNKVHGNSPAFELLALPKWAINMHEWRKELATTNTKSRQKELKEKLNRLEQKLIKKLPSRIKAQKQRDSQKDALDSEWG